MGKWVNVSAGPRQIKDLIRAASDLRAEGQSRDELYGVIGGTERRSTVMSMFGPVREEVIALDDEIFTRYGGQVTRENVRQIIADYAAAMPEAAKSRPVDDNRRTPEQEAERNAAAAAQAAEEQARTDARNAIMAAVMAKAPAGAKRLIYAELQEDRSDIQTDYFANTSVRTVAIGFGFSSREDFRALHAAAAAFPETAHLGTPGENEHRDNHSMGAGNYLSDHGSANWGGGWVVRSREFPCKWVHLTEDAIPDQPAAGGNGFYDQRGNWIPQGQAPAASGGAVTVRPSSIGREGVVEVIFAEKPSPEVRDGLKAHGFRWARSNGCWYGRDTAYAEELASA